MADSELIACARMYAVTPAAAEAWRKILQRVGEISGMMLKVIDYPPPAALEDLWARSDLGAVFMCGYPYTLAGNRHQIIAAPVPSPSRYHNRPVYFTDFVVRRESPFTSLQDTFGQSLAWTVSHSHSGYNAVRHHLLGYRKTGVERLYAKTIGPVLTPGGAAASVIGGEAVVAPIDSWVYDIWLAQGDERTEHCKVVESTVAAPIPPLVASPEIPAKICDRLREALLEVHRAKDLQPYFDRLALSHFVYADAKDYQVIAARAQQAMDAGYPEPA